MKVGIQLYSVRENMAKDPIATIRRVVETGYKYLEVANHHADKDFGVGFGVSASEIKKLLDESGAKIIGAHIEPINLDNIDAVIEYHAEIGSEFLGESMSFYRNVDEVKAKCELVNKLSEKCQKAGMYLCFHNHFHEFQKMGGQTVFDMLMEGTDKAVAMELDTYWVMRGGVDPVDVMKKYGERIRLVHQKDYTKGYEAEMNCLERVISAHGPDAYIDMDMFNSVSNEDTFTEIGTGIMDIQKIIDTAVSTCKSDYIILEQDHTTMDEFDSIKVSMDSFKKFSGIEWA